MSEKRTIEQIADFGEFNALDGRYVVLIAGINPKWFDDRSEAADFWRAACQGFKLGRASAFTEIRRLIGAKHDY